MWAFFFRGRIIYMISWKTFEFEKKERHPDWIWTAGLAAAIAATLCFFYGNIFFGIFLILAGAMIIIFALREPKELNIVFQEKELMINAEIIDYANIKQFWIDETEKPDKLLLLVKGSFVPIIVLHLEGVSAQDVRTEMLKHAPEQEMRESFGVKVFERLGF